MNKKKIIGIIASAAVMLALVGVGTWMFLQRSTEKTGGNRLGVEWYDVNRTEFIITTADELYDLSELSNYYDFKNQTIKLGADIVVNEGNAQEWAKEAPSRKWSPITGFGGVFDGQGHTISGLYAKGYDAAVALFSNTMSGATIQDLKLTNSYFESVGFGGVASISSNGGGKFKKIYSDAILNVVGTYSGFAGGICSKLNLQSTLEECWFDGVINTTGRDAGGIIDDVLGSRVTISHCLFSGEINSTWDFSGSRTGGIVGRIAEEGAGLILNDCLSTGGINAANVYYTGSVIGTTTKNTSLTTTNSYGSMGSYDVAIGRSGFSGTINSYPIELYARELVGTKAYQWTNLDFNKYWAIVEDDTPILKCFAEKVPSVAGLEKAFDTSWYTEGASEYIITDRADLYGLYMLSSSNTFSGKTIKVGADIAMNEGNAKEWAKTEPENVWYPILKFAGTFDGQGHIISGLYLNTAAEKAGFFKETMPTAIVKNMKLTNSYLVSTSTTNAFLGSISGRGGGTFDSIYSDAIMVSSGSIVGGLFAQVNAEAKNSFTNCWFDGSITMKGEKARYVGGIVGGVVKGNTTIAHCLNTAPISQLDFKDAGMFVGGIVGYIINDKTVGTISDCLNTGKISVNYHVCVGSVVGRLNQAVVTISDTYATNESYIYVAEKESDYENGKFRGIGTSSKGYTGGVAHFPESYLKGMGGYQWSTLNFKDYWTVVTGPDSTPILKSFASKVPNIAGVARKIDTSWYSADKKSFVLKDLADLYGFYAVSSFDTFYEDTVKLDADIVVNTGKASEWAQVAPTNPWFMIHNFKGTFDGQGHTISGVYLKTDEIYSGFFSKTTKESTVKNLKLTNSYFENTITDKMAAFGSVAGQMGGVLDTVYSDAIVVGKGIQIGGLVGRVNHSKTTEYKITNCWFNGKVSVTNKVAQLAYVGGVAGASIQGTVNVDNCLNTGEISYTYDQMPEGKVRNGVAVGGLVGGVINGVRKDTQKGTLSILNISDSLNTGYIHAQTSAGEEHPFNDGVRSIVGFTTDGTVTIHNDVYATSESAIGIINSNSKRATVKNSASMLPEATLTGTKGCSYTLLDFNKYWSARSEQTPALKSFVGAGLNCSNVWKIDMVWEGEGTKTQPYTLSTIGELFGFANEVNAGNDFEGTYFKLGADIDVNKGWTASAVAPEYVWIPISEFAGTFDGNDKTISGLYLKTEESYAGLFAKTTNTSTIKNLSIKNSYFESAYTSESLAGLGSVVGQMGGTLDTVYSDAIVVGKGTKIGDSYKIGAQIGGLVGRTNQSRTSKYKMTDCWFDGSVTVTDDVAQYAYIGGLVGTNVQGILEMNNCLNTGAVSYQYDKLPLKDGADWGIGVQVGGIIGGVMNGVEKNTAKGITSEVYITDCMNGKQVVSGLKDGTKVANGAGSIFGYTTDGTIVMDNVYAVAYCDADINVITAKNGGKGKQSTVTGKIEELDKSKLIGIRGYTNTTLDFSEHWKARTSEIPAIKAFVTDKVDMSAAWRPNTSWYNEEDTSFEIKTIGELYGFARLVNDGNDFAGKTIKLNAEEGIIDINPGWTAGSAEPANVWTPIGNNKQPFRGEFNGNGNTIRGIYLKTGNQYAGLFGCVENSKEVEKDCLITNFRLENSYFESTREDWVGLGSIAGQMGGNLSYVYSNAIVKSSASQVGGLVGRANSGSETKNANMTISNCWYDAETVLKAEGATAYVGGLVGTVVQGTLTMTNCLNSAQVTNETSVSDGYTAGLVGNLMNATATLNLNDSMNVGIVTCNSTNYVASVVGGSKNKANVKFDNVYTTKQSITNGYYELGNENKAEKLTDSEDVYAYDNKCFVGMNGYLFTELNFTDDWAVRANNVPSLKCFENENVVVKGQKLDINWYDESVVNPNIMSIETQQELFGFAWLVNNGTTFENQTVQLEQSITVDKNAPWIPIGSDSNNYFAGTFDGNKKEISGLNVNATSGAAGLFGYTVNCTVKDLDIKHSQMTITGEYLGSIVGYGSGTLDNVHSMAELTSSQSNVGGLVGCSAGYNMTSCSFGGKITSTYDVDEMARVGGLVGYAEQGTTTIANCLYSGDITCTTNAKQIGGILGSDNETNTTVVFANSVVVGTISGTAYPASVVGKVSESTSATNVYVSEDVCNSAYTEGTATNITSVTKVDLSTELTNMVDALNVNVATNNSDQTRTAWYVWVQKDGEPAYGDTTDINLIDTTPDTSWYEPLDTSKGTESNPYWISDAGDLYGLAKLVNEGTAFDGKVIKLKNSIKVNDGDAKKWAESEANKPINDNWTPIGDGVNAFKGIFDGQGYEITGLYLNTDRNYVGLFGYTVDSTIKNVSLKNTYFMTTATDNASSNNGTKNASVMGSIIGHGEGTLENIYSDAILVGPGGTNGAQIGGLIGRVQEKFANGANAVHECHITNSWFAGDIETSAGEKAAVGGLVGIVVWEETTIKNSMSTADIICTNSAATRVGGLIGNDNATNTTINVSNTVVAGTITGASKMGSVIGRTGKQTNVAESVYVSSTYTIDMYGETNSTDGSLIKAVKTDFTAGGKLADTLYALNTNVNNNATWDSWVPEDGKPVLSQFATEQETINITVNTAWLNEGSGTETDPYLLMNASDLYGLASLVNAGEGFHNTAYTNKIIKLACDIKVNNGLATEWKTSTDNAPTNSWTPIGNGTNAFYGIFDGNERTISGLYLNTTRNYVGLFGYTINSTIKNVSLKNTYFKTTATDNASSNNGTKNASVMGSIIGHGEGTLENIYSDAILVGPGGTNGAQIGGLIGRVQEKFENGANAVHECHITNCWFAGDIETSAGEKAAVGGLVGIVVWEETTIKNSMSTADIICTNSAATRVGGLIGNDNATNTTITVSNTVVAGTITGASKMGSVIGRTGKQTNVEASVYVSSTYAINTYGETNSTDGSLIKAVKTDFTAEGKLADTVNALNTNANANATWCSWVAYDGKPVLKRFAN